MITGHVHRHLSEFSEFLGAYYSKGTIKRKISDIIGGKLTYSQKALPNFLCIQIVIVQSLSFVWLFLTPWTSARQAPLSFTISLSLLKLMYIESVMLSNHLILCRPLLLPPSIFPSIRVFSKESVLRIRWPKYWSFSFSISSSNEYSGLIFFGWTGWISLLSKGLSRVFCNTTVQKHLFFGAQLSL